MKDTVNADNVAAEGPDALSAEALARRLDVSPRHIRRMDSAGLLPRPIRLGRSVRWIFQEIQDWLAAGAPDRSRWEASRASA